MSASARKLHISSAGTRATGRSVDSYFDQIKREMILTASAAADVHPVYAELIETTDTSTTHVAQVCGEFIETTDESFAKVAQL